MTKTFIGQLEHQSETKISDNCKKPFLLKYASIVQKGKIARQETPPWNARATLLPLPQAYPPTASAVIH